MINWPKTIQLLPLATTLVRSKSCRYNISGFVEELPQPPEHRWHHACAALPSTGVRLAQSLHERCPLCRHLSLLGDVKMDPTISLPCWPSSLEHQPGLLSPPSQEHCPVPEHLSSVGRLEWPEALMEEHADLRWWLQIDFDSQQLCFSFALAGSWLLPRTMGPVGDRWKSWSWEISSRCPFNWNRSVALFVRWTWVYEVQIYKMIFHVVINNMQKI